MIEPELPAYPCAEPYRGPGECAGCTCFSPHPPFFYAQIEGHARPRRPRGIGLWTKAVSLLALVFLATSTATMATLAWNLAGAGRVRGAPAKAPPPSQQHATPPSPPPPPAAPRPPSFHEERGPTQVVRHSMADNIGVPGPVTASSPPFSLSAMGRPTHAPEELWGRAGKLSAAGIDLVLTETRINGRSMEEFEREFIPSARIAPVAASGGVQIWSLPTKGSIARAAGLQDGDVVTAVNGYALVSPDAALTAYTSLLQRKTAVVEVRRGDRPLVIKIDWGTGLR